LYAILTALSNPISASTFAQGHDWVLSKQSPRRRPASISCAGAADNMLAEKDNEQSSRNRGADSPSKREVCSIDAVERGKSLFREPDGVMS
jgi:hypothetical protein